jgi:hypothetical protein
VTSEALTPLRHLVGVDQRRAETRESCFPDLEAQVPRQWSAEIIAHMVYSEDLMVNDAFEQFETAPAQ